MAQVYPQVEPLHWETGILPDQDGVYGLSAYRVDDVWLLVTFGLTELFTKESDDPETSGFGFELTLRVPADADSRPVGHSTCSRSSDRRCSRPVRSLRAATGWTRAVRSLARRTPSSPRSPFVDDPQLPAITSPYGAASFLEVVGITAAELAAAQSTSTAAVIERLALSSPLLVTNPRRV